MFANEVIGNSVKSSIVNDDEESILRIGVFTQELFFLNN